MAKKSSTSKKVSNKATTAKREEAFKSALRFIGAESIASAAARYGTYSDAYDILSKVCGLAKTCADIKSSFFASQTIRLYRRIDADSVEEITEAPVLDALRTNQFNANYLAEYYRETTGNSYKVLVETDKGYEIKVLFSQYMRILTDSDGNLSAWQYGETTLKPEDVFHQVYRPSTEHPIYGESPIHGVLVSLDILTTQSLRELVFQENNARPDYAIEVPLETTDQQIRDTETYWQSKLMGANNAGKFAVLRDAKIVPLGFAPKDLEGMNLRTEHKREILAAYRIPESMVALNDANLASSLTGNNDFLRAMQPLLVKDATELTNWLIPIFYPTARKGEYYFEYDDITPDAAKPSLSPVEQLNTGAVTINEWRLENGYEPIEGGDIPRFNGVPLSVLAAPAAAPTEAPRVAPVAAPAAAPTATPPTAAPAAPAAPNAAEGNLAALAARVETALKAFEALASALVAKGHDCCHGSAAAAPGAAPAVAPTAASDCSEDTAPVAVPSAAQRVAEQKGIWKRGLHLDIKTELPYAQAEVAALEKALKAVYNETLDGMVAADGTINLKEFEAKIREAIKQKILPAFQRGGQDGLIKLAQLPGGQARITSAGVSFDVVPEKAIAFLDEYSVSLARTITETQQTELQQALQDGLASNESIAATTTRVKEALGESITWKAERIARTETARAYVNGQATAWNEAGIKRVKPILAPGSCPECEAFVTRNKDGYSVTESVSGRIPVHPFCRCDEIPLLD